MALNNHEFHKEISNRKDDHIRINREENVKSYLTTGFEQVFLRHNALPEIRYQEINTSTNFLGKKIKAPILISSMTGGTKERNLINQRLAQTAEKFGIPMGVGSQRIVIQSENGSMDFRIRDYAPTIPLYANLGAVQFNYGLEVAQCQKAVDLIEADALILHLNPLQEVLQPEGQTNFSGLLDKIAMVCKKVEIPVIAKEVGWGISAEVAKRLIDAGVSSVDVAGAGGTSWAAVEKYRNTEQWRVEICEHFKDWGIPTSQCIIQLNAKFPQIPLIASGGIRHGIDVAKSIALGASIAGVAGLVFKAAVESQESLDQKMMQLIEELRIAMFATGSKNLDQLSKGKIAD
jgi:isopentenyl-diphosphate Delta-isomerase